MNKRTDGRKQAEHARKRKATAGGNKIERSEKTNEEHETRE